MLHKKRAYIYKGLSEKTRKFVDEYMREVFGVEKYVGEPGLEGLKDLKEKGDTSSVKSVSGKPR
jgi:hypothetical protein